MKFKLTEAISPNMKDIWQVFYKMSESDIIKLFGRTARTVSSNEPCFITPTGKIIDVGKALGFDYTMHVDLIIKILEHIYDSLYGTDSSLNDLIDENDIDREGATGLNWLLSNGWIAINLGSKYVDNHPYAVFPSREEDHPTTTQYDIVEGALEKAQKNKKERFIAFLGSEVGEWDLRETFAEDIIKSIKRYYSSGRIYENKGKDIMRFKLVEDIVNEIYPNKGETKEDFISRFMSVTKDEYPDRKQRYAVALSYWDRKDKKKNEDIEDFSNADAINSIEEFLNGLSFDKIVNTKDDFEQRIDKYEITVWAHPSNFGSAWTPKPVVAIQIDRDDRPNGFIGWGDIESQEEYEYAVKRLIKKAREKE